MVFVITLFALALAAIFLILCVLSIFLPDLSSDFSYGPIIGFFVILVIAFLILHYGCSLSIGASLLWLFVGFTFVFGVLGKK
jgi:hypothetical protein